LELEWFGVDVDVLVNRNRRLFRAWRENWEQLCLEENLTLTKKFENKYLGLRFYDDELKDHCT
jgi:hypothetical protein